MTNQFMLDSLTDLHRRQIELAEDLEIILHEMEYKISLDENIEEEIENEDYD